MALKQAASEKEKYEALIERMKSQIRQLEENGMALSTVCFSLSLSLSARARARARVCVCVVCARARGSQPPLE